MQKTPLLEEGTVLRGRKRHKTKYKASKHQQMLQNSNPVRLKHQRSIQKEWQHRENPTSPYHQQQQNQSALPKINTKHIQRSMPKPHPKVKKNNTEILPKSSKMSPRCGFGMAWSDFWGLTQDIVCQGRPTGAPHTHFLWILVLLGSTCGATWAI